MIFALARYTLRPNPLLALSGTILMFADSTVRNHQHNTAIAAGPLGGGVVVRCVAAAAG